MPVRFDRKLPDYLRAHDVEPGVDCQLLDDGEGPWIESWTSDKPRPTQQQVADWSNPVTDVERMAALFTQARQGAPLYLDALKGRVWVALVEGGMSQADATAAGVALVLRFGAQLAAFNNAGGHPAAALALYQAISSAESVAALPWLTAPILAIFQGALAPS